MLPENFRGVGWLYLGACVLAPAAFATESIPSPVTPQTPLVLRKVNMIQGGNYQFPYIPSLRTTYDGRVGIPSNEARKGSVQFFLNVPEKLNENLPYALLPAPTATPAIEGSVTPFSVADTNFSPSQVTVGGVTYNLTPAQHTICDGTTSFPVQGAKTNPYACGTGLTEDCYDVTIVASAQYVDANSTNWTFIYGRPVTIWVTNPKQASAKITNVTYRGSWTQNSAQPLQFQAFFEPMVTADGHFIVGRTNGGTLDWNYPWNQTKNKVSGGYNIVYSIGPQSAQPCDVTQWGSSNFFPIAYAPSDSRLNGTYGTSDYPGYGLADYPFKDSEGHAIPPTVDLEGTYPWIDRMGRNLFFFGVNSELFHASGTQVYTQYPEACPPGTGSQCKDPTTPADISNFEAQDNTRGLMVVGRWTHGKEVLLDGNFNNIDYGLEVADYLQRVVTLYQTPGPSPSPVAVQLGSGRANDGLGNPPGFVTNTTDLDSFENLFTYVPALSPMSTRDVVWRLNAGKGGDEVAFDDYIDQNAFIVSDMNASTTFAAGKAYMTYNNGFTGGAFKASAIHLQNGATSTVWALPAYGSVSGSAARVEPAALGGIQGKGFWLSGSTQISYRVPAQPQSAPANPPWFIQLFIDPRFADDQTSRPLVGFPDGSSLSLVGLHSLVLAKGSAQYPAPLPLTLPSPGWSSVSLLVQPGGTSIGVYLNGYEYTTITPAVGMFQLNPIPGNITVGGAGASGGFTGWIDDFKVLAEAPDPETICNHARGTLISVTSSSGGNWWPTARAYASGNVNEAVAINALTQPFGYPPSKYYACFEDYSSDTSAAYYISPSANNLPKNTGSVRAWVHFPEGPLMWNAPRPASLSSTYANGFCLSCHASSQVSPTLQTGALTQLPGVDLQDDLRRQPLQKPRLMFGIMPANIVPGSPAMTAPSSGEEIDEWDYPNPP